MYLSVKQHNQLRTIVMDFEVPYRSYVVSQIIKNYPSLSQFDQAIKRKKLDDTAAYGASNYNSVLNKIKSKSDKIYELINNSNKSLDARKVEVETDVPFVSEINTLVRAFKELFPSLLLRFYNNDTFWQQADKYRHVRNKLDHPACKTLEKEDMDITLEFISNVCKYLDNYDDLYFWLESSENIDKKIASLQTSSLIIPVPIHNFHDMPFSDRRVVCRENEIQEIKRFIYGIPGALRKKASLCIFGYGGVGKTALVLEALKEIVRDICDGLTLYDYSPKFILFFSAKDSSLDVSRTNGKIENLGYKHTYASAKELENKIFSALRIENFVDYSEQGIIVIDNLESLPKDERVKIKEFVEYRSPQNVQYIITSRNEEAYEERKHLAGFEDIESGTKFIKEYIEENEMDLVLSENEIKTLLEISKGNTLVLVLSIRRLGYNLESLASIEADITQPISINKLKNELANLPPNGYEIISEFMFKNTFQEIEKTFSQEAVVISTILKTFAVYPNEAIDIYTLSSLSGQQFKKVEEIVSMLCKYLIIEKKNDFYSLNQFAEKYIILRFLPDAESYNTLSSQIETSTRRIQTELDYLRSSIESNPLLKSILQDWNIITEGDRIAAAKAFRLYRDVKHDCDKGKFFAEEALRDSKRKIYEIEQNTMHPYIKYQKARILDQIKKSELLEEDLSDEIISSYTEAIWVIKTNPIFSCVKLTKSYASVLWLLGAELSKANKDLEAARYLEESVGVFTKIGKKDKQYYQCLTRLGYAYLNLYRKDPNNNLQYLRRSRKVSRTLYDEQYNYSGIEKTHAIALNCELKKYGRL